MAIIKIKKIKDSAVIPIKGSPKAACFDLIATDVIYEGENKVIVKYGFSTEIQPEFKAVIVPRSSFTHKGWIMANSPGQIDSDYRGEWMSKFERINKFAFFPYKVGDRVAQCFLEHTVSTTWKEVEELSDTERGVGGFGSTGDTVQSLSK